MKISVFGATGGTGLSFVEQALEHGHTVTCYVRRAGVLPDDPNVEVIVGELDNSELIKKAISGSDAILNVLGPAQKDPGNPIISEATSLIADAAIADGVRRQVVVTAWGVGERRAETPWFFRAILLRTVLKKSFAIKTQQEELLADPHRKASLDLTIVCPSQLVKGTQRSYRAGPNGEGLKAKVTRPGLAAFLLNEIEEGTWTGKSVVVGS